MKRLDDALYSTILLHSDSDGENSETETLHTAVPTISSNGDVTDGGIDAIDREQWITMDDNMVRARNAFTCDLRSKEESRAVMKVCTHKFMSTVIAEVRLRDFTSHQFYEFCSGVLYCVLFYSVLFFFLSFLFYNFVLTPLLFIYDAPSDAAD